MTLFHKCILALCVFLAFALVVVPFLDKLEAAILGPCPTEDSENCIWNAQTMGNHAGRSFIRWEGVTYYAHTASD